MSTTHDEADWRRDAMAALRAYDVDVVRVTRVAQGLINLTVKVETRSQGALILQRLHSSFSDAVNRNLARITEHLERRGLLTPKLIRTATGDFSIAVDDRIWRALTFIDGRALDAFQSPAQAREAGRLLARLHTSLSDFKEDLLGVRPPVHDLARHLNHLREVRSDNHSHRLSVAVGRMGDELELLIAAIPPFDPGRTGLVHGDAKISNILFARENDAALCFVDLDTFATMPLAYELGDAMRSWCNPAGEDFPDPSFNLETFAAALRGYGDVAGRVGMLDALENVAPATLQIYLELSTRFLADAVEESYFGWDPKRFSNRGEHNLARAGNQMQAGKDLLAHLAGAQSLVGRIIAGASAD